MSKKAITKKQIKAAIKMPESTIEVLRDLKILTAFQRNTVDDLYRLFNRLPKMKIEDSMAIARLNNRHPEMSDLITLGFVWSATKEGYAFWEKKNAQIVARESTKHNQYE